MSYVKSFKCQIRNRSVVVYEDMSNCRRLNKLVGGSNQTVINKEERFTTNQYSGKMSAGSIKRLSKAVNLLVAASERKRVYNPILKKLVWHKLSFITLTVPDDKNISGKQLHKLCLEPFIKWLRDNHNMKMYVWKLERQKRGQLHYHITADCFVHYQEIQNKWNKLIARSGLMDGYKANYGGDNPNSTDIHNVNKVNDLAAYLVKYMIKSYQNEVSVEGKVWDCSLNLKKANYYSTELTDDVAYDLDNYVNENKAVKVVGERFVFYKFKQFDVIRLFPKEIKEAYYQNLYDIRTFKRDLFDCPVKRNKKQDIDLKTIQNKTVPNYYQSYMFN